ncbi:MAG: type II toxin-antitoxin system VapC family toxin, partial [Candidatus Electrothrix sp. AR1]|nr:type II toxin-antitoxin system VapC family toxin [Candidatus Electrothrix sp. AR1]
MSGNRLVLDTNIVLGFLAGRTDTTSYLNGQQGADLYVSTVTRMELLSFPTITPEEEQAVNEFLDFVNVMPLDDRIEDIAIHLRRAARNRLPDAIIAATAIRLDATLVT